MDPEKLRATKYANSISFVLQTFCNVWYDYERGFQWVQACASRVVQVKDWKRACVFGERHDKRRPYDCRMDFEFRYDTLVVKTIVTERSSLT